MQQESFQSKFNRLINKFYRQDKGLKTLLIKKFTSALQLNSLKLLEYTKLNLNTQYLYPIENQLLIYKLMFIYDLHFLQKMIYDPDKIQQYIDNIYKLVHATTQPTLIMVTKLTNDNHRKHSEKMLNLFNFVIQKHLEIKQDMFVKMELNEGQIRQKYQTINNCIVEINNLMYIEQILMNKHPQVQKSMGSYYQILKKLLKINQYFEDDKFHLQEFVNQLYFLKNQLNKQNQKLLFFLQIADKIIFNTQQDCIHFLNYLIFQHISKKIQEYTINDIQNRYQIKIIMKHNVFRNKLIKQQWNYLGVLILELFKLQKYKNNKLTQILKLYYQNKIQLKQNIQQYQLIIKIHQIFLQINLLFVSFILNNQQVKLVPNQNKRVLFYGDTKCGKSSFLKFLTRDKNIKISSKRASETFLPLLIQIPYNNQMIQFWDLPGLNDNRSLIHRYCIPYILKKLTTSHKNLKLIYLLEFNKYPKQINNDYIELIKKIGKFLNWKKENLKNFIVAVSKFQRSKQKKISKFYKQLNQQQETISHQLSGQNQIQFQRILRQKLENAIKFQTEDISLSDISDRDQDEQQIQQEKYNKKRDKKTKQSLQFILKDQNYKQIQVDINSIIDSDQKEFLNKFNIEQKIISWIKKNEIKLLNDDHQTQKVYFNFYEIIKEIATVDKSKIQKYYKNLQTKYKQQYTLTAEDIKKLYRIYGDKNQKKEQYKQIIKRNLQIFFAEPESGEVLQSLFVYISQIIQKSHKKLKKLISKLKTAYSPLEKNIRQFTSKISPKNKQKIFTQVHKNILKKSSYIYRQQLNVKLQKNRFVEKLKSAQENHLITIIEQFIIDFESQTFFTLLENYLDGITKTQFMNFENHYEKIQTLKLYKLQNYKNLAKIGKNCEGVFDKISLSQFLQFNSIQNKKQQGYYYINCKQPKIYCNEFNFDSNELKIICKQLTIVTKRINIKNKCEISIRYNDDIGSLIILSQQKYDSNLIEIKNIQMYTKYNDISLLNLLQDQKKDKQRIQTVKQIRRNLNLITFNSIVKFKKNHVYKQLIEYNKPYLYIDQKRQIINPKYQIEFQTVQFYEMNEFGLLYLSKMVKQLLIEAKIQNIDEEKIIEISQKVINFTIMKFKKTVIKIQEENMNAAILMDVPQQIKNWYINRKKSIGYQKNIEAECYMIIKRNIFKICLLNLIKDLQIQYAKSYQKSNIIKKIDSIKVELQKLCWMILHFKPQMIKLQQVDQRFMKNIIKIIQLNHFKWIYATNRKISKKINLMAILEYIISKIKKTDSIINSIQQCPNYFQNLISNLKKQRVHKLQQLYSNENNSKFIEQNFDLECRKNLSESEYIEPQFLKLKIFLEKNDFENARNLVIFINPYEINSYKHQKVLKLYNVLIKKYDTIYNLSLKTQLRKQINLDSYIQQSLCEFKVNKFKDQPIKNNKINQQNTYNILTFDAGQFNNKYIVNILMAAEIQKCTHRPIKNMFHFLIGESNASVIANLLGFQTHASKSLFPGSTIISFFNSLRQNFAKMFQQYYKQHIGVDLGLVSKNTQLLILKKNEKMQQKKLFNLVNKLSQSRPCYQQYLFSKFNNHLKNIKQNKFILALGSGRSSTYKQKDYIRNGYQYNRWQLSIDHQLDMADQSTQFYINQTRLFIEQKWINQTSEMRNLMDKLENTPIVNQYK